MANITPNDLAEVLGVTAKETRKFLRAITPDRATKGGRWAIPEEMTDELVIRFDNWKSKSVTVLTLDDLD